MKEQESKPRTLSDKLSMMLCVRTEKTEVMKS